ncbi:pyridoxal-phosphate-dependent aminotransferase family protein [Candidatus Magnetomonas plexicatena]|uniref:pyridoxal-phosphate-dependent aminotransferase family protein n=1 Tax=Candidatus Magnetomonas plexicatena TaxID=2552947 RepID=UPI001C752A49|nr:alanine--glyoxylate aminotransferase family protein [Nitrospirales bacterium LBB_01]
MLKRYLLAPGPTPVPPEALLAMAMPMIHHRAPDFIPILDSAREGLKWLYQTKNDVLILSCSGTGGMVASVTNFFNKDDKVLVINGGKFGERWLKIAKAYGLNPIELKVNWGYSVKPDDVADALKKDSAIKGVFIQATETSTAVNHDIEVIGKIVKNHDAIFVVDAISSLVAHDLKTDDWSVDIMVGGSQKGLMLPPGLAFVSVSEKAWKMAEISKLPHYYFNLKVERQKQSENQTNFTSPVTLIIGLNECIKILEKEGLQNVFDRHTRLANATRAAARALGLGLYAKENPSNAVTAIEAPEGVDGQKIYKVLRETYGVTCAGGQDAAKGKIFRIAHLGYADRFDIITAVSAIEMTLRKLGAPVELGKGVAACEELLF